MTTTFDLDAARRLHMRGDLTDHQLGLLWAREIGLHDWTLREGRLLDEADARLAAFKEQAS